MKKNITRITLIFVGVTISALLSYFLVRMFAFCVSNIIDIPLVAVIAYCVSAIMSIVITAIVFKKVKQLLKFVSFFSITTFVLITIFLAVLNWNTFLETLFTIE